MLFGDTRNLIKRSPVPGCGALVISAAVNGNETLEIARQRPEKLYARRRGDKRYRARSHFVPFALQDRRENIEWGRAQIFGLSVSAIPSRLGAANASPDLTLLNTIRSAPSRVLFNFSAVDMSYAGPSTRFPGPRQHDRSSVCLRRALYPS